MYDFLFNLANFKNSSSDGLAGIWDDIPLKNREVFLLVDTDFFLNKKVFSAGTEFIKNLVSKQAQVKLKGSSIANEWNNDYFKHIRKEFLEGRWPENCKRCEYVESLKGNSKRIEENYYHYDNNKHLLDQTAQDGSVPYYPSNIDIRVGTIIARNP